MGHRRDVRVAIYVGVEAVRALVNGSHPESSAFGFAIAAISLVVLPVLGAKKLRVAGSSAVRRLAVTPFLPSRPPPLLRSHSSHF